MFMVELLRVTPRAGPPNYSGILIFLPTPGGINERIKPNLRDVSAEKCGADVYRESSVNDLCETRRAAPRMGLADKSGGFQRVAAGGLQPLNLKRCIVFSTAFESKRRRSGAL